ncbi:MAG: hypothetical protein IT443_05245 [Phycisphaeraceae bacterium]|nr:hypothetical protein [Phycisphaeraceae bacterium]
MPPSLLTNDQKQQLWADFHARRPTRVPMQLDSNPRIFLLNPALNTQGYTFEQAAGDPKTHIDVYLQYQLYLRTQLNQYTDLPTGIPDVWPVNFNVYNVYEAAYFGAPVQFPADQVPCTEPFLTEANRQDIFKVDIEHPLENPFIKKSFAFWHEMQKICKDLKFQGRPVRLVPWNLCGSDGPLTVACNLRGSDFLIELLDDPAYADRLLDFIMRAAILRRQAFWDYWDNKTDRGAWLADDSCEMLSLETYQERLMPLHRRFYEATPPGSLRVMHLCGDAGRLFPVICRELGARLIDTGFPIDLGQLRRQVGPDVQIQGGVEVSTLMQSTPDQVYQRSKEILQTGVKTGGKFIFKEANNFPPAVPLENVAAMYQACQDFGPYPN